MIAHHSPPFSIVYASTGGGGWGPSQNLLLSPLSQPHLEALAAGTLATFFFVEIGAETTELRSFQDLTVTVTRGVGCHICPVTSCHKKKKTDRQLKLEIDRDSGNQ